MDKNDFVLYTSRVTYRAIFHPQMRIKYLRKFFKQRKGQDVHTNIFENLYSLEIARTIEILIFDIITEKSPSKNH